jgi:hypothetical protein
MNKLLLAALMLGGQVQGKSTKSITINPGCTLKRRLCYCCAITAVGILAHHLRKTKNKGGHKRMDTPPGGQSVNKTPQQSPLSSPGYSPLMRPEGAPRTPLPPAARSPIDTREEGEEVD